MLTIEGNQPLCLPCARLDQLEFLPRGDTALTRRAAKHSWKLAIVVRFIRSRGRYERQGILAEPEAIEKAEQECLADADQRAAARKRGAEGRRQQDQFLTAEMILRIRELFPRCPPEVASGIAVHTAARGSGRVGRSAAGRALAEEALMLAVAAYVRHRLTDYDILLEQGMDRALARDSVRTQVNTILDAWRRPSK